MTPPKSGERPATEELLAATRDGDVAARDELTRRMYDELKRSARAQLRKRPTSNLATTELVHEACIKLFGGDGLRASDRAHFLALCAETMRHVLIDRFRSQGTAKRGAGVRLETLESDVAAAGPAGDSFLALNEALERLARTDPRMGRVVEYKFFGGMTEDEIAEVLQISKRTVSSEWRLAKAWLSRELEAG